MEPTAASTLASGLTAIMSSVDRVKRSIEVQKQLASVQSSCQAFSRQAEKKPDRGILLETWKIIRQVGLDEIDDMIADAESSNTTGDLVAWKELKQAVSCAGSVETNLKEDNQGKMNASFDALMKSVQSALTACRNWNEQELTRIRSITYKLLNP